MEINQEERIKIAGRAFVSDPEGAFAPFYELTKQKVFYLLYSYLHNEAECEDLLQESYIALLENAHSLRCRHNPEAYLMVAVKNRAIDALRKKKPAYSLDEEGVSEVVGLVDKPPSDVSPLLQEIASLLTPFEYQVYLLHGLSDLSFKEIARLVKRPLGTLTYTYSLALRKLQKGLDPQWLTSLNNN
jgi:RNA polymerase sigma-70 factor (ECF subfamily)